MPSCEASGTECSQSYTTPKELATPAGGVNGFLNASGGAIVSRHQT
jgi:hypothetical protein